MPLRHALDSVRTTRPARGRAHLFLDGRHHAVSRLPAVFPVLLVVPLLLLVLQVAESALGIPPVVERFGTFTSPVDLPAWANVALTLVAAAASTERALRLRYSALLDGS